MISSNKIWFCFLRNMRPLHLWMLCAKYGKEIVNILQLMPTMKMDDEQILIKNAHLSLKKLRLSNIRIHK